MIKLECLQKEDLVKIIEWNEGKSQNFILQWSGPLFKAPLTIEQLEGYYINEIKKDGSNIYAYKVVLTENNEMIGTVELREMDKEKRTGRVGRFLIGDENSRGKGVGSTALNEILKIGFESLNFEKITLAVFDFNKGAIKYYEKCGFKIEKFLENARKAENEYWNLYEMAILRDDWKMKDKA